MKLAERAPRRATTFTTLTVATSLLTACATAPACTRAGETMVTTPAGVYACALASDPTIVSAPSSTSPAWWEWPLILFIGAAAVTDLTGPGAVGPHP